jgi:hypothetical protein
MRQSRSPGGGYSQSELPAEPADWSLGQEGSVNPQYVIQREGKSYALYAGLLDLAHERGLLSIETVLVQLPTEANGNVAVVQATVRRSAE